MSRFIRIISPIFIFVFCGIVCLKVQATSTPLFQLKPGDLLFQDLNCGAFCDGIDSVTEGVNHTKISHVGMVIEVKVDTAIIIEAIEPKVTTTPLETFLARSRDENGNPRVIVGRLNKQYTHLIAAAIDNAQKSLGKPYNASFYPNHGESKYCSQLIFDAFKQANHNQSIFHINKMNFYQPGTTTTLPIWKSYYSKLKIQPPQGLPGTNPGMMSREPIIKIIHNYGGLTPNFDLKSIA